MNKAQLRDHIASAAGVTKKQAAAALEAFIDAVSKSLKKGNSVTLTGFGVFKVAERQAREGRNPQTGAKIKIAKRKVAKFSAGKTLRELVK